MLAETIKIDVFHHNHLAVIDSKQRAVQNGVNVGIVAARQKLQRLLNTGWRPDKAFATWIFSQLDQHLCNQIFHVRILHGNIH